MPKPTADPGLQSQLRLEAEARLEQGTAPYTNGWLISVEALTLLHRLASNPASAGDALKLLHELQAHQVELDLQHAQLEVNERSFAQDLDRYKALFDFAPVGYFVIGPQDQVMEGNLAGERLLGSGPDDFGGRPIGNYLAPESRPVLSDLLTKLHNGSPGESCAVKTGDRASGSRVLRVTASLSPGGEAVLMLVSEHDQSMEV